MIMSNKVKLSGLIGIVALLISFSFNTMNKTKTIIIDAGHGGADAGAQFDGIHESRIVKNIAKKISELNKQDNLKIILLRNTDESIALSDRVAKVNEIKPDLLISLHINSSRDTQQNGIDAVLSKENVFYDQSKTIAQNLLKAVSGESLKEGKFWDGKSKLLKESNCPAVILEVGFLSNEADRDYVTSEKGQNEIAKKILESFK